MQCDSEEHVIVPRFQTEPNSGNLMGLESDFIENQEYYVFVHSKKEVLRRKIGGWINVTQLSHLIDTGFNKRKINQRIEGIKTQHKYTSKYHAARIRGTWIPLEEAVKFAKEYQIYEKAKPILGFNRVAKAKYFGVEFYEYFASPDVDTNIRILRDIATNQVNMDQIFTVYNKMKSNPNLALRRSFFANYRNIVIRSENTLYGGHWVDYKVARRFAKKHGILSITRNILDFEKYPYEAGELPIDQVQKDFMSYWLPTLSSDEYFGFPMSFKSALTPQVPYKKKIFALYELTTDTQLNFEITTSKSKQPIRKHYRIYRRLSDGAVNASSLIEACCGLRIRELALSKEDPDFITANVLSCNDVLQDFEHEVVVNASSKYVNGKWCSAKDARALFTMLKIPESQERERITRFLNLPELEGLNQDSSNDEEDDDDYDDDDDDDGINVIEENVFVERARQIKQTPFYDRKFFEDEPSSSDEEIEYGDFGKQVDGITNNIEEDEEEEIIATDEEVESKMKPLGAINEANTEEAAAERAIPVSPEIVEAIEMGSDAPTIAHSEDESDEIVNSESITSSSPIKRSPIISTNSDCRKSPIPTDSVTTTPKMSLTKFRSENESPESEEECDPIGKLIKIGLRKRPHEEDQERDRAERSTKRRDTTVVLGDSCSANHQEVSKEVSKEVGKEVGEEVDEEVDREDFFDAELYHGDDIKGNLLNGNSRSEPSRNKPPRKKFQIFSGGFHLDTIISEGMRLIGKQHKRGNRTEHKE